MILFCIANFFRFCVRKIKSGNLFVPKLGFQFEERKTEILMFKHVNLLSIVMFSTMVNGFLCFLTKEIPEIVVQNVFFINHSLASEGKILKFATILNSFYRNLRKLEKYAHDFDIDYLF